MHLGREVNTRRPRVGAEREEQNVRGALDDVEVMGEVRNAQRRVRIFNTTVLPALMSVSVSVAHKGIKSTRTGVT